MTGRLFACEIARSKLRVSVIGPVSDEVRGTLGSDPEADEEFKKLPGGLLITLPVEHASKAQELLNDGFNSFVDMAMARVRRRVGLEDHVPEAVAYIAGVIGRDLPQPEPVSESKDPAELHDILEMRTMPPFRENREFVGVRQSSSMVSARLPLG